MAIAPAAYTAIGYDPDSGKSLDLRAGVWLGAPDPAARREGRIDCRPFTLPPQYQARYVKQLRTEVTALSGNGVEYLVASSMCYGAFYERPDLLPVEHAGYEEIFHRTEEMARFPASPAHLVRRFASSR